MEREEIFSFFLFHLGAMEKGMICFHIYFLIQRLNITKPKGYGFFSLVKTVFLVVWYIIVFGFLISFLGLNSPDSAISISRYHCRNTINENICYILQTYVRCHVIYIISDHKVRFNTSLYHTIQLAFYLVNFWFCYKCMHSLA